MNIIHNNRLDFQVFQDAVARPEIFQKSTARFWDDEHVSTQMLKFHLNPAVEAASKTKETIEAETAFIIQATGMDEGKTVLDLGCGPGLYVRQFATTGAQVTGIDLSARSIRYANENIKPAHPNTDFLNLNYLDIHFCESFDAATLIFYDFCALNTDEQDLLLDKVHAALKEQGFFIFDIVTENRKTAASTTISACEGGGFWRPNSYMEILNTFLYEKPKTEGFQYTIIDEDGAVRIIRIYHRLFGLAEITKLLHDHRFRVEKIYKNLKGEALDGDSETYGIIARKA